MRIPPLNILDQLFSTWGHIVLLRSLATAPGPLSGRGCARSSGMTHRAAIQSLERLVILGIVTKERKGRSTLYALSESHRFNRKILPQLLDFERSFLPSATKLIRKYLSSFAESVILHHPAKSPRAPNPLTLSICVIIQDPQIAQPSLELLTRHLQRSLGISIIPLIVSLTQFRLAARQESPEIAPFLKEGTVIMGKTLRELLP